MKIYLTEHDAVCDLHKKGFNQDFQILGNDLMWVQEKILVRAGEFAINECHQFNDRSQKGAGTMILGVTALYHNVKGVLIRHYSNRSIKITPVILKKLKDMFICSPELIPSEII